MISITRAEAAKILEMSEPIKGFEDYYISTDGTIISLRKPYKPCILMGTMNRSGAIRILMKDARNRPAVKSVHRLVAETFIPNPNNLPDVIHKDGNMLNNNVSNLEWVDTKPKKFDDEHFELDDYDWKPIKDYPGYDICKEGFVLSKHGIHERILRPFINNDGYEIISLSNKYGKSIPKAIHRLLAETFIPNPNCFSTVKHKDGNISNNSIGNLEWCRHCDRNFKHRKEINKYLYLEYGDKVILASGDNMIRLFDNLELATNILGIDIKEANKMLNGEIESVNGIKLREISKMTVPFIKEHF